MGIGATDFIRLLMRKLTFDRIRLSLAAFIRERWRGGSQAMNGQFDLVVSETRSVALGKGYAIRRQLD
jgi:hypothetical protein